MADIPSDRASVPEALVGPAVRLGLQGLSQTACASSRSTAVVEAQAPTEPTHTSKAFRGAEALGVARMVSGQNEGKAEPEVRRVQVASVTRPAMQGCLG